MNRHRFPNPKMFDVVLEHLDAAVQLGFKVEIQAVLTAANTADEKDLACRLRFQRGPYALWRMQK